MKLSKSLLVIVNHSAVLLGFISFAICMIYSAAPFYDKLLFNLIMLEGLCIASYLVSLLLNAWEDDNIQVDQ